MRAQSATSGMSSTEPVGCAHPNEPDTAAESVEGSCRDLLEQLQLVADPRKPRGIRHQLVSHLPADAASLLEPPRRVGVVRTIEQVHELYAAVVGVDAFPATRVPWVVTSVLGALASLVPDDAAAVTASLPIALRHIWKDAAAVRV